MSFFADRVQETSTTIGTGTLTLSGVAATTYFTFASAFADGTTVRYVIQDATDVEVGQGVYSSGTLTRVTVFTSSNSNSLVSFAAGVKAVWCDISASTLSNLGGASTGSALYRDSSGNVAGSTAVTINNSGVSSSAITCTGFVMALYNPAGTFKYNITAAAIAADRTITFPLLVAGDTFVCEAFTQTLTNKTINGASNTLTVRLASDVSGSLPLANSTAWVTRGTYASRAAAGTAGRVYLCTDGPLSFYDDGAAWQPFIAKANLTSTPAVSGFTQINAGSRSTTLSDSKGGILMQMTNAASAEDYRIAKITAPGSAYSLTVHMYPMLVAGANAAAGICFRKNSNGSTTFFGVVNATAGASYLMIRNETYSGTTFTFSSDALAAAVCQEMMWGDGVWLRITDDLTTNKSFHYSLDGTNFIQMYSVGRTSFATPDEIGIWVGNIAAGTTNNATAFFSSWLVA